MNTTLVFVTQFTLSLLSFGLIARWVIYPRLRDRPLRDALTLLLLFETLRTIGLIDLVPGLVDAALPAGFIIPEAVGDMLAVVLAFAALVAVRSNWRVATALVWLFTVEGLADFINATAQGLRLDIVTHNQLGLAWLLPTYGVPAFAVAQLIVIALLLYHARRERQPAGEFGNDGERTVTARDRLTASIS
ncbi:MAG: hypothetical protein OJF49_004242 [Ktedonobacterales bacterium]|jgi:hypothetical protein|nr:MAG: hypothetical protein OJF49_004242 [Ktedonobacterales bacterium]